MKLALVLALCALAGWPLLPVAGTAQVPDADAPAGTALGEEDCEPTRVGDTRFEAWDLFVDSGSQPCAAWQVEVVDERGLAQLVGVEGGEHPAYATPAHYDPRALLGGRVVLAAFQLDGPLPSGRAHVARLHFQIRGSDAPHFRVRLEAAATPEEVRIAATAELARH